MLVAGPKFRVIYLFVCKIERLSVVGPRASCDMFVCKVVRLSVVWLLFIFLKFILIVRLIILNSLTNW